MVTKRRVAPDPARTTHVRETTWAGLAAGDPVDVDDQRERRSSWRFVAHVTNATSGESWVEVVGGKAGEERLRAFRPDQLFPYRSIRAGARTGASFADAPGLPF